jgi:hypothetical protein
MKHLTATICLTIAVLFGNAGVSLGEGTAELRPLRDILREESSNTMKIYAIERCSSLFLGSADNMRTREELKIFAGEVEEKGINLAMWSFLLSKRFEFNRPMENIKKRVFGILTLYKKRWKQNSYATGHYNGPLTKSDLKTCVNIYNQTQTTIQKQ